MSTEAPSMELAELSSTWRSLLPVVDDRPLALCDSRSVMATDLLPCDRIVPDHNGEVYFLKYNPNHRW
jgi:hypothetical protein